MTEMRHNLRKQRDADRPVTPLLTLLMLLPFGIPACGESRNTTTSQVHQRRAPTPEIDRHILHAGTLLGAGKVRAGIALLGELRDELDHREPIDRRIAAAWLDIGERDSARRAIDSALASSRSTENLMLSIRIGVAEGTDPERTAEEIAEILANEPGHLGAWKTRLYLDRPADPHQRAELYEQGLQVIGDEPGILAALYNVYTYLGDFDRAVEVSHRTIALDPSPLSYARYIVALAATRDSRATSVEIGRILQTLDPDYGTEFVRMLQDLYRSRDAAERNLVLSLLFDHVLERASERTTPAGLLHGSMKIALESGRFDVAESLVPPLLGRESVGRDAWHHLAEIAVDNGAYLLAAEIIESQWEENVSRDGSLLVTLGKAYFGADQLEKGLEAFTRLGDLDVFWLDSDADAEGWIVLARLHALLGNRAEALAAYRSARDLYPHNIDLVLPFARFLAEEGIHARYGLSMVDEVLEGNRNDPDLLESYARLALMAGNTVLAVNSMEIVARKEMLTPFGFETLGLISVERGDTVEAVELWREGLRLLESAGYREEQTDRESRGRKEREEERLRNNIQKYRQPE